MPPHIPQYQPSYQSMKPLLWFYTPNFPPQLCFYWSIKILPNLPIKTINLFVDKAPGLNGVPPNAFKAMSPENLKVHFNFILEFWNDNMDFEEWHEGRLVPVPKSRELSDPNKWRGVNLMDIGSKIFSSLM